MKIYGYIKGDENGAVKELCEVTLHVDLATLNLIRDFVSHAMEELNNNESAEFGHLHLKDFVDGTADFTGDVIIIRK